MLARVCINSHWCTHVQKTAVFMPRVAGGLVSSIANCTILFRRQAGSRHVVETKVKFWRHIVCGVEVCLAVPLALVGCFCFPIKGRVSLCASLAGGCCHPCVCVAVCAHVCVSVHVCFGGTGTAALPTSFDVVCFRQWQWPPERCVYNKNLLAEVCLHGLLHYQECIYAGH